jgi:hypothetical protein
VDHQDGDLHPVEKVTWEEAKNYCEKLYKFLPMEVHWGKAAKSDASYSWLDGIVDKNLTPSKRNKIDENLAYSPLPQQQIMAMILGFVVFSRSKNIAKSKNNVVTRTRSNNFWEQGFIAWKAIL